MAWNGPNWLGLGKTLARGPHTNDPTDPQYTRHWDVVPGSLGAPNDDRPLLGAYRPDAGALRASTQANLRFSGGLGYVDRAVLPEPAIGALKPLSWAARKRSIDPVAIPLPELGITEDARGLRTAVIPQEYGGGRIVERPHAIPGRANDASVREQLAGLAGFFSRPRQRR